MIVWPTKTKFLVMVHVERAASLSNSSWNYVVLNIFYSYTIKKKKRETSANEWLIIS